MPGPFSSDTAAGRVLLHAAGSDDPAAGGAPMERRKERAAFARTDGSWPSTGRSPAWPLPSTDRDGTTAATVSALVLRPTPPAGLPELLVRAAREVSRNLAPS